MEDYETVAKRVEEDCEARAKREGKKHTPTVVKKLIIDIAIRWNSTFLMLERAYEFRKVRHLQFFTA